MNKDMIEQDGGRLVKGYYVAVNSTNNHTIFQSGDTYTKSLCNEERKNEFSTAVMRYKDFFKNGGLYLQ
jgi:hypothetical protein